MVSKFLGSAQKYIALILCATTLSCFIILSSITASADVVDDVTVIVPAACTLNNVVDVAHVDTIQNGHLVNDIGTTTFTAYCNDNAGFSIYAIGYSGNTYGNTDMLASAAGIPNIATGLATSGDTSAWAMKLIPITDTYAPTIESDANGSFANYHIVPSVYTKVATFNTTTDRTIGSKMQSTYRVFASATQPADTYTGKVKYTMVHPASEVAEIPVEPQTPTAGCINYFANVPDAVGTMGCQSATDNTSVTLLASNFSRTGYGFAGWSDAFDYKTNTNANFYGPNETITAPVGTTANGLALYAVWVKSEGNLQSWSGCSSLTKADESTNIFTQSITALSDSRDNNTYAVARLADGNCWMIENLRLQNTGADNTNGSLAQGYGGQFAGLADPEPAWADNITTANSLYSTDGADDTINIGTSDASYRFPRYNNINTSSRASTPTSNAVAMYSYGNYYTWSAAIADTTAYTSNNTSVTNTSICPTGWRLPQGGNKTRIESDDDNDFWNLTVDALNNGITPANYSSTTTPYYSGTTEAGPLSKKLRSYPNNFVYSGNVFSGSVNARGTNGGFWSSTASSSSGAYDLVLNSSAVRPGTDNYKKYNGRTVRCVVSGV